MGSLLPAWYVEGDEERMQKVLPAMKALLDSWEELGANLLSSFDDDFFVVGPPASADYSIYLIYDVPSLDIVVNMLQLVRGYVGDVRLDRYLRFEARIGRPLFLATDAERV